MNNKQQINKLAIYLKIQYEAEEYIFEDFNIKKICGMNVNVKLEMKKVAFHFYIQPTDVYTVCKDGTIIYKNLYWKFFRSVIEERTIEDYKNVVKFIFELIPQLTFDKFNGKLIEKKEMIDFSTIFTCFENIEQIEMEYNKCSCCFEKTKTKTKCNHYLCIECWDKIERIYCEECNEGEDDCENEDCGQKRCPICRKDIEH